VYCSKHANGEHSIAKSFASDDGNIWFERTEHIVGRRQVHLLRREPAPTDSLTGGEGLETHAYAFIHTDDIRLGSPRCLEATCSST
jgi:site-specific DNA-methyltransferase (adenine-specific)